MIGKSKTAVTDALRFESDIPQCQLDPSSASPFKLKANDESQVRAQSDITPAIKRRGTVSPSPSWHSWPIDKGLRTYIPDSVKHIFQEITPSAEGSIRKNCTKATSGESSSSSSSIVFRYPRLGKRISSSESRERSRSRSRSRDRGGKIEENCSESKPPQKPVTHIVSSDQKQVSPSVSPLVPIRTPKSDRRNKRRNDDIDNCSGLFSIGEDDTPALPPDRPKRPYIVRPPTKVLGAEWTKNAFALSPIDGGRRLVSFNDNGITKYRLIKVPQTLQMKEKDVVEEGNKGKIQSDINHNHNNPRPLTPKSGNSNHSNRVSSGDHLTHCNCKQSNTMQCVDGPADHNNNVLEKEKEDSCAYCGIVLEKGKEEEHAVHCKRWPTQCCICGFHVARECMDTHRDLQCPGTMVSCPSCGLLVQRKDAMKHQFQCPEVMVQCDFAKYGCPHRTMKRKYLKQHLEGYRMHHLQMVDGAHLMLKAKVNILEKTVGDVVKAMGETRERLLRLEDKVDDAAKSKSLPNLIDDYIEINQQMDGIGNQMDNVEGKEHEKKTANSITF